MKGHNTLLSLFVSLITLIAITGAGSASWWTFHQPKLPKILRK